MIISEDRTGHWTHLLVKGLKSSGCVSFSNQEQAVTQIRRVLNECVKECAVMDQSVKNKICSLQRNVMENSSEWGVLYSNYMHEEMIRNGFTTLTKK